MTPRIIHSLHIAPAALTLNALHTPDGRISWQGQPPAWQKVPIAPGATLTTETTLTAHGTRHTHTLQATTCTRRLDPTLTAAAALLLTLADGTCVVMGCHRRPWPFIRISPLHPATPQEQAAFSLTATLTTDTPLPITV